MAGIAPSKPMAKLEGPPMSVLRFLAAGAVGGLTLTATLVAGPAHAAAPMSGGTLQIHPTTYDAGDCTVSAPPADVSASVTAGDTITRSVTINGSAVSGTDATDTVALHATQEVKVSSHAAGGQLTTLQISAATTGSAIAAKGAATHCTSGGSGTGWNIQSGVTATLHRATAGWLHSSVRSSGIGGQGAASGLADSVHGLLQSETGAFGVRDVTDDQWVYVPAGDYLFQSSIIAAATTYPDFPKASTTAAITLTFLPAGVAKVAETGSAKPDVTFPGRLTCPAGKAAVRFTSKVEGASKAVLFVNGKQRKSIGNPSAGTVTLKGLPTDRSVTLKAVVTDHGHTLSATRAYRSC
jgi:hypothetical protein